MRTRIEALVLWEAETLDNLKFEVLTILPSKIPGF